MACDLLFTCLWSYAIIYKMSDTFLVSDSSFCRKASHFSELQIEELPDDENQNTIRNNKEEFDETDR